MRSIVVLTACLSLLLPPSAAATEPGPEGRHAVRATKTVTRGYGDGPVRQSTPRQRVELRFRGERGDRVRLAVPSMQECATVRLHRGAVRLPEDRAGYHRLRRSGWHRFTFRPCRRPDRRHRLQLTRLRVEPLVVDGARVRVDREPGYDDALRVEVPEELLALVRRVRGKGLPVRAVLPPTGSLLPVGSSYPQGPDLRAPVFVRPGRPLEDVYGPHASGTDSSRVPLTAGQQVLVFPAHSSTWQASTPAQHPAAIDGPAVHLETGGVAGRAQDLTFSGVEGQWVRLADVLDEEDDWLRGAHHELVGPGGTRVPSTLWDLWRLPADGAYRLTITPSGRMVGESDVRLRSVREIEPVPSDGTPRAFAVVEPGEMLVAPVDLVGSAERYDVLTSAERMTGSWVIHVVPVHGDSCDGRPPTPNGCADFVAHVGSDSSRQTTLWAASSPYFAVLRTGDETGGEVSLGIRPAD